ncbi:MULTISPECIES: hypothetical protein [Mesorhizobium]|uniref:hypothetical protein n=1 Tax=Mesorhizobium sp. TaxID=1871066 RepID=UPI00140FEFCB|nr:MULTISPECIES: hypothetical protein [Mesorhizobium]
MPKVFLARRCLAIRARTKAAILHLICAQPVDMPDLRQVIWCDKPVHDRLEMDA